MCAGDMSGHVCVIVNGCVRVHMLYSLATQGAETNEHARVHVAPWDQQALAYDVATLPARAAFSHQIWCFFTLEPLPQRSIIFSFGILIFFLLFFFRRFILHNKKIFLSKAVSYEFYGRFLFRLFRFQWSVWLTCQKWFDVLKRWRIALQFFFHFVFILFVFVFHFCFLKKEENFFFYFCGLNWKFIYE